MVTDTPPLEEEQRAFRPLVEVEPLFAGVLTRFGPPPCWRREQGFATLIRIILEQQVSLASAQAAFDRLCLAAGEVTPARFLLFDNQQLKEIGLADRKDPTAETWPTLF